MNHNYSVKAIYTSPSTHSGKNPLAENTGPNPTPEVLNKQLRRFIEIEVTQHLVEWSHEYQNKLLELSDILDRFAQRLNRLEEGSSNMGHLWREWETMLRELYEWIEFLPNALTLESQGQDWQEQFQRFLETVPMFVDTQLSATDWVIHSEDDLRVRIWKRKEMLRMKLGDSFTETHNRIQGQNQQRALDSPSAQSEFNLHLFLRRFGEIPVAKFLLTERLRLLQLIARQLHEFLSRMVALKDETLLQNDLTSTIHRFDVVNIAQHIEKVQSHVKLVQSYRLALKEFGRDALQRFQGEASKICQTIQQNWNFAGAYIIPLGDFSSLEIVRQWKKLDDRTSEGQTQWDNHFIGEREEWQATLELSILQLQAACICCDTLGSIKENVEVLLVPAFTDVQETIGAVSERFAILLIDSESGFKRTVDVEKQQLLTRLQLEKIPQLLDGLINAELPKVIRLGVDKIYTAIDDIADEHILLEERDLENLIPESKTKDISLFKEVIFEEFAKLEPAYTRFSTEHQGAIERISNGIAEIEQIVEFNLEAALSALVERDDMRTCIDTRNAIVNGLSRSVQHIDGLIAQAETLVTAAEQRLPNIIEQFESELQELLNPEKMTNLHLRLLKTKAQERILNVQRELFATLQTAPRTIYKGTKYAIEALPTGIDQVWYKLGMKPREPNEREDLEAFLTNMNQHIQALPQVYQRLFRLDPLHDERFFSGRKVELDALAQGFATWKEGAYTSTALVGENGCGVTTLLNYSQDRLFRGYPVVRINLEGETLYTEEALFVYLRSVLAENGYPGQADAAFQDMDQLEAYLMALDERTVFIIENLQDLFLRTTDGFGALERFMLLVSHTHHRIHWVITCSLYTWRYLSKVIEIDKYAQKIIEFKALSQEEIQAIILKRHRASGYELSFTVTDEMAHSRGFKRLSNEQDRQTYFADKYFAQLSRWADGNITVALLLWLRSCEGIVQNQVTLSAGIRFDLSFLNGLSDDELFTLATLLLHNGAEVEHHAKLFRQSEQQSMLLLNRMTNTGLLVRNDNRYKIHPFLYRGIVQLLKDKNILH